MAKITQDWMLGRTGYSLRAEMKRSRKIHKKQCNKRLRRSKAVWSKKGCTYKRIMSLDENYSHVT